MSTVGSGQRELTKFVSDHILRNQYGNMLATIMNSDGQSYHLRQNQ